jgi:hypothetical protein
MNQAVESRKYFDLHLRGLGYLSRVRDVTARGNGRSKAKPFLACSVSAFHGDPDVENGIVYLPLDLIVSGEKAKEAVRAVMDDANDRDTKVLISFRAGDHYIRTFERTGNRAGETGAVLKGRLLKVFWIKVDGEYVYQDETDDADSAVHTQADDQSPAGPRRTVSGDEPNAHPDDTDPPADDTAADRDDDVPPVDSGRPLNRHPAYRRSGDAAARPTNVTRQQR